MKNKIKKSENRTTVGYELSACQKDFLLTALSHIEDGDTESKRYVITINEIEEKTGRKWSWEQIDEATKVLGNKVFIVDTEEYFLQFWLLQHVIYDIDNGDIEVMFSEYGLRIMQAFKNNLPEATYSDMILLE